MPRTWRILSIDGGGIRGLIPATVLASIEERTGKPIHQLFDLIAGTSTGAILTLGLTKPDESGNVQFGARNLRDIYERDAPGIFKHPATWWENLLRPKYKSHRIRRIMAGNFGEHRLKEALTDILIPCYDIEHRTPHVFRSRWARRQGQYHYTMSDVASAAAATPTMFDPLRIPRPGAGGMISLVDGGVFANNPSGYALAEIQTMVPDKNDQILLVSLGTGESMERMRKKYPADWGFIRWSIPMVELVSESISEGVHRQMKDLLPPNDNKRYYRFQVDLPDDSYYPLDNVAPQNIRGLIQAADEFLKDKRTIAELDTLCARLLTLTEQEPMTRLRKISNLVAAPVGGKEEQAEGGSSNVGAGNGAASVGGANGGGSGDRQGGESQGSDRQGGESQGSDRQGSVRQGSDNQVDDGQGMDRRSTDRRATDRRASDVRPSSGRPPILIPTEGYDITVCHAREDEKSVALPLAAALKKKRIVALFVPLGQAAQETIHPLISQAAETTLITVVIFSKVLLKNTKASQQLAWLFSRTLSGENVIVPVIHGFTKDDIADLITHMQWHDTPSEYLEYLMQLAVGSTDLGIDALAKRLYEEIVLWLR